MLRDMYPRVCGASATVLLSIATRRASDGQPANPASFSSTFDRLVARSGLPRIRLHDLRHTYATLDLRLGTHPVLLSERLGHTSIASQSIATRT